MATAIDTRISPALHPDNVKEIEGYGDADIASILAPTMTAFSEAYEGLRSVHNARDKARLNPTWNEAAAVIHTQDLADKVFARVAKGFDATSANLQRAISHIEKELSQPVEAKAAQGIASEIRAHLKGLRTDERMTAIREAIASGDHLVATSVLGAPAMLSGFDPKMQAVLLRQYHERHNPHSTKRLKAMQAAKAMIDEHSGKMFRELEKAVGMAPHKVQALRAAKTEAEKAFVLAGN